MKYIRIYEDMFIILRRKDLLTLKGRNFKRSIDLTK